MSFDPRSLERLRELGRQLPQPLPRPEPPPAAKPGAARLHPVESEQDPDRLFHELIKASPDGTVPPHLLQRLKEQEARRQDQRREQRRNLTATSPSGSSAGSSSQRPARRQGWVGTPDRRTAAEHPELYSEFHQLLLEGDEED